MLNLVFAPSADILVPIVMDRMRGAWTDPFDPPVVIVPNPAVGKWLHARLIETPVLECVAGARLVTLERFLWNALSPEPNVKMLDAWHLTQVICAMLDEKLLADGIYRPLRNYLSPSESYERRDSETNAIDTAAAANNIDSLKRVQLSARIAQLFLEYEYNRPSVWDENTGKWRRHGIDASWLLGKKYDDGQKREAWQTELYGRHEAWQRALYRKACGMFTAGLNGGETRLMTLPHLYRHVRETRAENWCDVGSNPRVFLFGVSKISHFHRNTLVDISQTEGADMHVFLTNPCAEFWQDIDTSRKPSAAKRKWRHDSPDDQAGFKPVKPEDYDKPELDLFENDDAHTLLKNWGRAGQENIFLWCPQAHWNFEYHQGGETTGDTLLHAIQRSLLSRQNDLDMRGDLLKDDRSVQILACPDMGREIEEVREMILDMANDGTITSFDDAAIYIPDPGKYTPYIQRVFGAYPQSSPEFIPFTILGAPCGSSVMARGLSALLNIAGGQFNRARIFELLRNPIVRSSKKFSERHVEIWEGWAEQYGMFRGYDAEQRRKMGDLEDMATDDHTFMGGMKNVDCEGTSAQKFTELLGELNALSSSFINCDGLLDIQESVETIRQAVWSWLGGIPSDDSINGAAEALVRREALDGIGSISLQRTLAGRGGIGLDEFIALAHGSVPKEAGGGTSARRGVTFAPLRAAAVLPHRVVFAIGLGAADFPGTSEKGSWDLLSGKCVDRETGRIRDYRIIGDSDHVRDNRFAFLELMHAAKTRLTLSYVARNMQTDEPLQPSSVILEFEKYLSDQGLGGNVNTVRRNIPWIIHESLREARERGRKHGTWDRAQRELADESAMKRVRHRHDLADAGQAQTAAGTSLSATDQTAARYTADLWDLKLFFTNPLEYHLRKNLGIVKEDEDSDMSVVDEPTDSGILLSRLKRKVWTALLKMIFPPDGGGQQIADEQTVAIFARTAAEKIYNDHAAAGQAPEGYIRRMETKELLKWSERCAAAAMKLTRSFNDHVFAEQEPVKYEIPYSDSVDFVINGYNAMLLVPKHPNGMIGVLAFDKENRPADNHGLWLEATVRWLAEAKCGGVRPIRLVTLDYTPAAQFSDMTLDSGGSRCIETWLVGERAQDGGPPRGGILPQMLIERRCEHLPFKIVADILKPDKCGADENFDDRLKTLTLDAVRDALSQKAYDPRMKAFDLTDAKPPSAGDGWDDCKLRETVRGRYAPMLERRIHG